MSPTPIAFFAFNRLDHTQQSLTALAANRLADKNDLVIFCDGPRSEEEKLKTDAVQAYCKNISGFKSLTVVAREENYGCKRSIIAGLMEFFNRYNQGVVVEDDIVFAPNALEWFSRCLRAYEDESALFSIGAWSYPQQHMPLPKRYPFDAYFFPRFQCWGWASWADRITKVDWDVSDYATFSQSSCLTRAFARGGVDILPTLQAAMEGRVNSWAIRAAYAAFKHGQLSLAPVFSYATNIGAVGDGTHVTDGEPRHPTCDVDLSLALDEPRIPEHIFLDEEIMRAFHKTLQRSRESFFSRGVRWLYSWLR